MHATFQVQGLRQFGAGIRYVGDAYGDNTETVRIPSYSLIDATVSYRWKDLKAQLAVSNLIDESYVTTCSGGDYFCWYGNRRNVIASLRYDF